MTRLLELPVQPALDGRARGAQLLDPGHRPSVAPATGRAPVRAELQRLHAGTSTGPAGTFRQRTEISPAQAAILEQLGIDPPPKIYQLTLAASS